jgi:hypothetical protein
MTDKQIKRIVYLLEGAFVDVHKELIVISSMYDKKIQLGRTVVYKNGSIKWVDYKTENKINSQLLGSLQVWTDTKLPLNLLFPIVVQQYLLYKLEDPNITMEQVVTIIGVYLRVSKKPNIKEELVNTLKQLLSEPIFKN